MLKDVRYMNFNILLLILRLGTVHNILHSVQKFQRKQGNKIWHGKNMLLVGEGGQVEVSHVGTIPVKGEKISQIKETNIFQSGEMK